MQFVRYAPLVKQRGGAVMLRCQSALVRLLAKMPGIDRLVAEDAPLPPFDLQAPLLSLPGIFHTTVDSVPASVSYLHAEPNLKASWRRELGCDDPAARPVLRVGIAWQGNAKHRKDQYRSIPLSHFTPLAQVDGVQLISLQRGPGAEQLRNPPSEMRVRDLTDRLGGDAESFSHLAAIIENLDLVITCDTSIAHLAVRCAQSLGGSAIRR